jgi:hypothetical protein
MSHVSGHGRVNRTHANYLLAATQLPRSSSTLVLFRCVRTAGLALAGRDGLPPLQTTWTAMPGKLRRRRRGVKLTSAVAPLHHNPEVQNCNK